jgi:hypothetical protein
MLGMHIPRYSARISDLKAIGYGIARRRCEDPTHRHSSVQFEWFIEQPTLF